MGISRQELERTREYHPTLRSLTEWETAGPIINAVVLDIEGRTGGQKGWWLWGPNSRQVYQVILNLCAIRTAIPAAWVLSPADAEIRHLNVFHGNPCPVLGRPLPMICWGSFAHVWTAAAPEKRTLGAASNSCDSC